jgi:hypothetical protein
MATQLKN